MRKIWLGILLGGALSSFFVTQNLRAYDQQNTHPALTDEAVDFYNLNFPKNPISEKEKQLLIKGAVEEDVLPRPVNHFYDPVYQRGWAGYRSSKVWARSSAQQQETRSLLALNPWSLQKSSENWPTDFSYERALLDYAKGNRERAFEAFGHVMHLLEDANVPEHTRNDTHIGISHDSGSPYESTMAKWSPSNFDIAKKLYKNKQKPVLLDGLDKYFDAIAGYSNGYFFSEDTIESEKYDNPKIVKFKRVGDGSTFGIGIDKNGSEFEIALFNTEKKSRNIVSTTTKTLVDKTIGAIILDGYWERLSKDFVLHGAGALKMFLAQAEEFKKEYEIQQALKKENKRSIASIFGFGNQKNGIALVQEFLNGSLPGPNLFEDSRSGLSVEDQGLTLKTTEVRPYSSPKVEPLSTPEISEKEIQQSSEIEPFTASSPSPTPTPIVILSVISNGGSGGNQTAGPTPTPSPTQTLTPSPTPLSTPELEIKSATRKVVINEIAWMGTASSSNDEWVELYNASSQSVDLTGWILRAQDGTPNISIAPKSINPFSFYLLERTSGQTISDVVSDQIYTGAFGNGGEILELRDASGNLQDIVSKSASGGWYAGNNITKSSMERINPLASGSSQSNWGTNNGVTKNGMDAGGNAINGTPKVKNSLYLSQKPSTVTNLALSSQTNLNNVFFTWTIPSDADSILASLSYDFRYATKSFDTTSDWNNAIQGLTLNVDNFSMTIEDFNKTYYFALKTKDADNNVSDISNQVSYLIPSAVSVSSGWPMSGYNQLHTLKMAFSGPSSTTATKSWEFGLPSGTSIGQPIIAPSGKIYFGASLGAMSQLYAIAPSGSESWHYDGTSGASIGTPVALADNSVIFNYSNIGTDITRLSANGVIKYANNIGAIKSVMIDKYGIAYLTTSTDKIISVGLDGLQNWEIMPGVNLAGLSPTILNNGKAYITSRLGGVPYFYAFDTTNGATLWPEPKRMDHNCLCGVSDPSYDEGNDMLYAAADKYIWQIKSDGTDSEAFFADRANGQGMISTMISIDNDHIIVGIDYSIANPASQSAVLTIDKITKNIAWSYSVDARVNGQISIDNESNVYFATQNGKAYSLDSTGNLNWTINLGANTAAYPVIDSTGLYLTLNNGKIIKVGE